MTKVLYKPVGMLVSVLGGVLAGAIFKQVWKIAFSEDDAPKATDADRSWQESSSVPRTWPARFPAAIPWTRWPRRRERSSRPD